MAHVRIIDKGNAVYLDDGLLALGARDNGQLLDIDDEIS